MCMRVSAYIFGCTTSSDGSVCFCMCLWINIFVFKKSLSGYVSVHICGLTVLGRPAPCQRACLGWTGWRWGSRRQGSVKKLVEGLPGRERPVTHDLMEKEVPLVMGPSGRGRASAGCTGGAHIAETGAWSKGLGISTPWSTRSSSTVASSRNNR